MRSERSIAGVTEPGKERPGGRTARVSAQIQLAALDMLAEQGFSAFNLQALAERAGVNRSTLYRRWRSRAHLVLDAAMARLGEEVAAPDTGSFGGDLETLLGRIGAFLETRLGRALLEAATTAEFGDALADARRESWRLRLADIMPVFARAVARGEIAADADSEALLGMAAGALHFRLLVIGDPIDKDWIARVVAATLKAAG